jgi:hypothetical protein
LPGIAARGGALLQKSCAARQLPDDREERLETGLLEVVIRRQGLDEVVILHDDKR